MSTNAVYVYRELGDAPDSLLDWLEKRNQLYVIVRDNGDEHVFIDNELPRDSEITNAIIANTKGFALFTEEGDYIGSYRSLDRAIAAQGSARVVVQAEVEADADDDFEDDDKPA